MTIDDRSRHELFTRLDEVLGHDHATTLMGHLPPSGWADVATKADLEQLERRMNGRFEALEARLEARFDSRFGAIDSRFGPIDSRFDAIDSRFDALDSRFEALDSRFEALEHRLTASFRGEINAAITAQTRAILLGLVGAFVSAGSLVLAATRLG